MVDVERVCCMCGDVGFPDKIFRCKTCNNRFQHSYCSNYYDESADPPEHCDWCQAYDIKSSKKGGFSKKPAGAGSRSKYSCNRIKLHDREEGSEKRKLPTRITSPRISTRRYKLLKDVML